MLNSPRCVSSDPTASTVDAATSTSPPCEAAPIEARRPTGSDRQVGRLNAEPRSAPIVDATPPTRAAQTNAAPIDGRSESDLESAARIVANTA